MYDDSHWDNRTNSNAKTFCIVKCNKNCKVWPSTLPGKREKGILPIFSTPSYAPHVGRIHAISIRRGSMEHINKKSFPACTRVTAHATSLQPLQPIFLALTSREAGRSGGYMRPSVREGWRRGVDESEHERVSRRERGRCERKGERKRKEERKREKEREREELEGWRLSCGSISLVGENLLPTNETSPSKSAPSSSSSSILRAPSAWSGPRTSTSRIDSLAILPRTARMCSFFPRKTRNSSSNRRWSYS